MEGRGSVNISTRLRRGPISTTGKSLTFLSHAVATDALIKKENQIFLIYKDIQSGAVAKSYMRKGFLIYEEMRKYVTIYKEAVSHISLCNCSILNFLLYEENLIFFLISVAGGGRSHNTGYVSL